MITTIKTSSLYVRLAPYINKKNHYNFNSDIGVNENWC